MWRVIGFGRKTTSLCSKLIFRPVDLRVNGLIVQQRDLRILSSDDIDNPKMKKNRVDKEPIKIIMERFEEQRKKHSEEKKKKKEQEDQESKRAKEVLEEGELDPIEQIKNNLKTNNLERAKEIIEENFEDIPENEEELNYFVELTELIIPHEINEAKKLIEKMKKFEENNLQIKYCESLIYMNEKQFEKSEKIIDEILSVNKKYIHAICSKSLFLKSRKEFEKAEKILEEAWDYSESVSDYNFQLELKSNIVYHFYAIYSDFNYLKIYGNNNLFTILKKVMFTTNFSPVLKRIFVHYHFVFIQSEKTKAILSSCNLNREDFLRLYKNFLHCYLALSHLFTNIFYYQINQIDNATTAIDKAIEFLEKVENPPLGEAELFSSIYYQKAVSHYDASKNLTGEDNIEAIKELYLEVLTFLDKSISFHFNSPLSWKMKGEIHYYIGLCFNQAFFRLFILTRQLILGEFEDAAMSFKNFISTNGIGTSKIYTKLAYCLRRLKKNFEAIEAARKGHELDPNDHDCTLELFACLYQEESTSESEEIVNVCEEISQTNPAFKEFAAKNADVDPEDLFEQTHNFLKHNINHPSYHSTNPSMFTDLSSEEFKQEFNTEFTEEKPAPRDVEAEQQFSIRSATFQNDYIQLIKKE